MNIDSIIFDLDGTLWDSTEVIMKAWNKVVSTNGQFREPITLKELQGTMGLLIKDIGRKLLPHVDEVTTEGIMELCCKEEKKLLLKEGGTLYPNLEDTLKILSEKYSLFIVSNCQCGYIETFLEYHNMGKYFKDIECAGNTGLVKGENIKKIIERNNLKVSVYVGDTQGDCDGASLANIPFVYASYGFGKVTNYDYILEEVADLISIF
ncbi:HAD family hydrolase [Clostridium tunisiense]|uniref:HAD family hydrolase n=1 Tax=Clostridium tunisiense TaxID=219748 RepID=UPI0003184A02|nr:HAD family hydrolase [Clostridium tunisiense]